MTEVSRDTLERWKMLFHASRMAAFKLSQQMDGCGLPRNITSRMEMSVLAKKFSELLDAERELDALMSKQ